MTLQTLPKKYRDAWKGGLSVDHTAVRAPSQLMPWRRDRRLPGNPEKPELRRYADDNGDMRTIEVVRPVLENRRDAVPATHGGEHEVHRRRLYEMAYAPNIPLMVTEPQKAKAHPELIMAASLQWFGRSTAEHTLAGIKSIQGRGWNPSHLTADRGYSVGFAPASFHGPLSRYRHRSRLR